MYIKWESIEKNGVYGPPTPTNLTAWKYEWICLGVGVHDDVTKWKLFPHYWPFVQGIHRSAVNSLHEGQWREALMFSLICTWINDCVNNGEAGDLRCHSAHYDVTVMYCWEYLCHISHISFSNKLVPFAASKWGFANGNKASPGPGLTVNA